MKTKLNADVIVLQSDYVKISETKETDQSSFSKI
jgi:hypothetical protein